MNVLILRLLKLYKPYWGWMALSVLFSLASVLANAGLMAVSGWFIAAMGIAGATGATINYFTPAAVIRALAIIRTGGRYAERLVSHEATFRLLAELRRWTYERLEPLAPEGLQEFRSGDLLARIRTDIDRLELFFLRILAPTIVAVLAGVVFVAVLAVYHPLIGLSEFVLLVAAGGLLPFVVARAGAGPSQGITRSMAELNASLVDSLQGLGEVQVYGLEAQHFARTQALSEALIADEARMSRLTGLSQAGVGLAANLALWLVLLIAIPAVTAGDMAPPNLPMLALLALASFEAVLPVPLALQGLAGTLKSAGRLFALADASFEVRDPPLPAPLPPRSDVSMRGVSLRYAGSSRPALEGLDLELPEGKRIAILGPTGSGKSSVVNLLMRFWVPTQGTISLGGVPLNHLEAADIRSRMAVVPQSAHLFAATIGDNLRIAKPDASQGLIEAACRTAQIHDFIMRQPDGYDTYIGSQGLKLSGGEARRLAIARALLKDAPILILDEPTEGMDVETERAVLNALLGGDGDRSVLLITHRPAGLDRVDEIVVLENGQVLERGTYRDLKASRGRFARMLDVIEERISPEH